jgi:hypothetical protein
MKNGNLVVRGFLLIVIALFSMTNTWATGIFLHNSSASKTFVALNVAPSFASLSAGTTSFITVANAAGTVTVTSSDNSIATGELYRRYCFG